MVFSEITIIYTVIAYLSGCCLGSTLSSETVIPNAKDWRSRLTDEAYNHGLDGQNPGKESLYEGDILGRDMNSDHHQSPRIVAASAESRDSARWTEGIVAYEITDNFSPEEKALIEEALQYMMRKTCIHFVPRNLEQGQIRNDYISFDNDGTGCVSYVGRIRGKQQIGLMPGCMRYIGEIQHEVMHALGFYHEQNRSDRDDYVSIAWSNVQKGAETQFEKYETNNLNMPYDYESVMHYNWNYFATNRNLPTIISKKLDGKVNMGNRKIMTALDVEKINRWYKSECDQRSEIDWPPQDEQTTVQPSSPSMRTDQTHSTGSFASTPTSVRSSANKSKILERWMILFTAISFVLLNFCK